MTDRSDRKQQISKLVFDAMAKVQDADWTKTSPEISTAEMDLNEAMTQYVEGATSKANVASVYQRWRDLHKTGALFT